MEFPKTSPSFFFCIIHKSLFQLVGLGVVLGHEQRAQHHRGLIAMKFFPWSRLVLIEAAPPEFSALTPGIEDDTLLERLAVCCYNNAVVLEGGAPPARGEM